MWGCAHITKLRKFNNVYVNLKTLIYHRCTYMLYRDFYIVHMNHPIFSAATSWWSTVYPVLNEYIPHIYKSRVEWNVFEEWIQSESKLNWYCKLRFPSVLFRCDNWLHDWSTLFLFTHTLKYVQFGQQVLTKYVKTHISFLFA